MQPLQRVCANQNYLEVVESYKLLGLIVRSDMRWIDNTSRMCQKGYKRLWMIRRLKGLGASVEELKDVYIKQVRSVLELAVPAWHSGLTKKQTAEIERVQRVACNIILSDSKTGFSEFSYDMSLVVLGLEPLEVRERKLCETFARKSLKSRHSVMFSKNSHYYDTRNKESFFTQISRTRRCYNSPLNYLTRILNGTEPL